MCTHYYNRLCVEAGRGRFSSMARVASLRNQTWFGTSRHEDLSPPFCTSYAVGGQDGEEGWGGVAERGEPWFICIGCVCVCVCTYICGCLLNILGQVWAGYVCIRKWVMYKDAPGLSPPTLPSPPLPPHPAQRQYSTQTRCT